MHSLSNDISKHPVFRAYDGLSCAGGFLQSFVLLALRLTWGWELAEAGWGHLHNVEKTAEFFKSLNIPFPTVNVYISGTTELVGGSLLMIGLATRLISVPLVFNFIVAFATASIDTLKGLAEGPGRLTFWDKFIDDSAFPMLMLALIMLAFGPGKASIDHLLKRTVFKRLSEPVR